MMEQTKVQTMADRNEFSRLVYSIAGEYAPRHPNPTARWFSSILKKIGIHSVSDLDALMHNDPEVFFRLMKHGNLKVSTRELPFYRDLVSFTERLASDYCRDSWKVIRIDGISFSENGENGRLKCSVRESSTDSEQEMLFDLPNSAHLGRYLNNLEHDTGKQTDMGKKMAHNMNPLVTHMDRNFRYRAIASSELFKPQEPVLKTNATISMNDGLVTMLCREPHQEEQSHIVITDDPEKYDELKADIQKIYAATHGNADEIIADMMKNASFCKLELNGGDTSILLRTDSDMLKEIKRVVNRLPHEFYLTDIIDHHYESDTMEENMQNEKKLHLTCLAHNSESPETKAVHVTIPVKTRTEERLIDKALHNARDKRLLMGAFSPITLFEGELSEETERMNLRESRSCLQKFMSIEKDRHHVPGFLK